MIVIRLATTEDRKGIDSINNEFRDHEYSHSSQYYDEAIAGQKIFVAIENDQVIGYLGYHILWGNTPFLELVQVTSTYQRKGVGAQLLAELANKLKADGYNNLISSTEKINDIGNAFHKKRGFQAIGELDMIYGKEVFYLKKLS